LSSLLKSGGDGGCHAVDRRKIAVRAGKIVRRTTGNVIAHKNAWECITDEVARETGGLWENPVYILSILYPVKANPIPRFNLAADPIIAYSYPIVALVTLYFPDIKFVGKTTHSWELFEDELFYFFAVSGRQFRQIF